MGNIPLLVVGFGIFVAALIIAILYRRHYARGKSHAAVSGAASIVAICALFFSLFEFNWPMAAIVLLSGGDQKALVDALAPSSLTILAAAAITIISCILLYRLSARQLASGKLPINASALELEEFGRSGGVFELAYAHFKFVIAGKRDAPLTNPGEDPYTLPRLEHKVDWAELAADMLVQLEPALDRDTFQLLWERRFFRLTESDAFDETKRRYWIVRPIVDFLSAADLLREFDEVIQTSGVQFPGNCLLVICVRGQAILDEIATTPAGHSVRMLSELSLLQSRLDLRLYVSSLVKRFEQRRIPGVNYALKDCFVPPRAREVRIQGENDQTSAHGDEEQSLLAILSNWAASPGVGHISIIGEYGQGKSTAVLAFCTHWARDWQNGSRAAPIPLLIELRGKSPRRQAQDSFLGEWGGRFGLSGPALLNLVKAGRAILIFEGFDEVQDAGMRFDRFEQFRALWSFSYPGSKIIFTGRPNFFLDTAERTRLLRNAPDAGLSGLENSKIYSLSFLNVEEIGVALQRFAQNVRGEILDQCRNDPSFADIARRPSMLPVIGTLWPDIRADLVEPGQLTSAAIINRFIAFLYGRKEADVDRLGEYQLLHRTVRHFFTQRIALKMVAEGLKNTIDQMRFNAAVENAYDALDSTFRMGEAEDPEIADSLRKLKERFKDKPRSELIAAIATDVRTNGLFAPDAAGGRDNLYFPHKQYFEFVLGEAVTLYLSANERGPSDKSLNSSIIARCIGQEPVSLFFASGLLSSSFQAIRSRRDTMSIIHLRLTGVLTISLRALADPIGLIKSASSRVRIKDDRTENIIERADRLCPSQFRAVGPNERSGLNTFVLQVFIAYTATIILSGPVVTEVIREFTSPEHRGTHTLREAARHATSSVELFQIILHYMLSNSFDLLFTLLFALLVAAQAFLTAQSVSPAFKIRNSTLFIEIYRRERVQAAVTKYNAAVNAAIVLTAARALPTGAVPFRRQALVAAAEALGLDMQTNNIAPSDDGLVILEKLANSRVRKS